jgi:hypothetical protein
MRVRIQRDFSVALSSEMIASLLKFAAKFLVIEDLTVEDDDNVAISTLHRLVARFKIHDSQASGAQRNLA